MLRNGDALFGVGLLLLWIGGLATNSLQWLTWLDFVGAICAFYLAAYGWNHAGGPAGTIAIGAVLVAAWIVALALGGTTWLTWANFGLGCAFLIIGVGSAVSGFDSETPPRLTRPTR